MNKIPDLPLGQAIPLDPVGGWPATVHLFDEKSANAITTAMAANRPLLIRGEPGTGKSQLARAAAQVLGRLFVSHVVNARSESEELQYHFDTVGRLGEAQALGAKGTANKDEKSLDPHRFLSPGPLWWAFDCEGAGKQHEKCKHKRYAPKKPSGWSQDQGVVLLIDEIDKADADLPNGLLETLGNGSFTIPWIDEPVGLASGEPPLVIITTNEERELPGAFVRRCLVLHLALPEKEEDFKGFLSDRGFHHFKDECDEEVRLEAARQVWEDRKNARTLGVTPPGQAEYLDILQALVNLKGESALSPLELLKKISQFALKKFG